MHKKLLGYIEGYYGVMLSWEQRRQILDTLHAEAMNTYIYAPKEDPYHRSQWKTSYPKTWMAEFSELVRYAADKKVTLVPGIAPGLSYVYGNAGDYKLLLKKCRTFVESGITTICLLMDDIPVRLPESCKNKFSSLGAAHGALLTSLSADLNKDSHKINLWFCPSVYTNQFIKDDDESAVYLADLARAMVPDIMILWTGPRIVPESISKASLQTITGLFGNNVCIWDNLYANDYCPHKLFIGPYTNRPATLYNTIRGMLINPTGLVHTDMFLLTLLADQARGINAHTSWKQRISSLTVAQEIRTLAPFFSLPHSILSEKQLTPARIKLYKTALKKCIWDWKSPLHREWYPFLFMLDSDLSLLERSTNSAWITKKYPPVLASILNRHPI
jgi:protein O-GlcNAcase/histone acetyltransferase